MKNIKSFILASALLGSVSLSTDVSANVVRPSLSNIDSKNGTYTVNINKETNGKTIVSARIAIWTEENGQDDLKWYNINVPDGAASFKFNAVNHTGKSGTYVTHVYVRYNDGTEGTFNLGKTSIQESIPLLNQSLTGISLKTKISPQSEELWTAVWSVENGQDDLKWYRHDTSGTLFVPYLNHKGLGKYHVDTYKRSNGNSTYIGNNSFSISEKPTISHRYSRVDDRTMQVVIENVPSYIKNLTVPVWTDAGGQDDLKWYPATKIGETTYSVDVNLRNHKYTVGRYSADIYGENHFKPGRIALRDAGGFTIDSITKFEDVKLNLSNVQANSGTFDIIISETSGSKFIQSYDVAVWTEEKGQDDLKWFRNNTVSNGTGKFTVDVKKNNNISGRYNAHVYVKHTDGSRKAYPLPTTQLNAVSTAGKIDVGTPDSQNTYPVGQCTWGVKKQASWIGNYWGNARDWIGVARSNGFTVNKTPAVGAVIVWPNAGVINGVVYGHVAYVVAVDSPSRIQVKESNYAGNQYVGNFRGWFNPTGEEIWYIHPKN